MAGHNGAADNNPSQPESLNGSGKLRLFVAIELPEFVKEALAKLQAEIRKSPFKAKWTDPENIHLTLKFLGDTPVSCMDAIHAKLGAATAGFLPITLWAAGLSVFPGPKRPRVLWTGARGETDKLARLHKQVEDHLSAIGFEKEDRSFKAHLTLARFKGRVDPENLASVITRCGDFATDSFTVDALCLFESRLTPQGPVYRRLQRHTLKAA